jgi:hypothetical protein
MAKDKSSPNVQAKIRRLKKLARETAELSLEIFEDVIKAHSVPVPPKPKKRAGTMLMASSVPIPPKPKFESLADIAHGALTIEESLPGLDPAQ